MTGVAEAYEEARACMSVEATTAAELLCRKILMHGLSALYSVPGLACWSYILAQ